MFVQTVETYIACIYCNMMAESWNSGISIPIVRNHYQCNSRLTANRQSQSHVTTDGQSASLSWNKAPIWGLRPDFQYCQMIAGLLIWDTLSDKRTGLFFTMYNIQYIYILRAITWMYIQYIQGLCQSRLSTAADHVLSLVASAYEF
jgi:hypothetical protein